MLSRVALLLSVAVLLPAAAAAQEATTTRIEDRPFYGATVTLEAGVRVYRPLPPHSKVVINPGGRTPVSLGFDESRSINHNYNYGHDAAAAGEIPAPLGGYAGYAGTYPGYSINRANRANYARYRGNGHARGGLPASVGRR